MPPIDHKAALARLLAQAAPANSGGAPAITVYGGQVQIVVVTGGVAHFPGAGRMPAGRRPPHIYKEKPK